MDLSLSPAAELKRFRGPGGGVWRYLGPDTNQAAMNRVRITGTINNGSDVNLSIPRAAWEDPAQWAPAGDDEWG